MGIVLNAPVGFAKENGPNQIIPVSYGNVDARMSFPQMPSGFPWEIKNRHPFLVG